jgi:hypothetical protein
VVGFKDSEFTSLNERLLAYRTDHPALLANRDGDCSISPRLGIQALPEVNASQARREGGVQDRKWLTILAAAANCAR